MYNLLFSPQVYPGGIFTCNAPGLRAGGYFCDFHKTLIHPSCVESLTAPSA